MKLAIFPTEKTWKTEPSPKNCQTWSARGTRGATVT